MPNLLDSIHPLKQLTNLLTHDPTKQYYLVCGSAESNNKTLIYYLLGQQLEYGIDEQGQDFLSIVTEVDKIVIIQNMLELYHFDQQSNNRYIWLKGFPDQSMQEKQKIIWAVALQYIIHLLSACKFRIVFTFSMEEELPALIGSFYTNFKVIKNLVQITSFVLTKIIDEDQFNQFVEKTYKSIVQVKPDLSFLTEIIDKSNVHAFFLREVDSDQQQQLFDKLSLVNQKQTVKIQLSYSLAQSYSKQWAQKVNAEQKITVKQNLQTTYKFIDDIIARVLEQQSGIQAKPQFYQKSQEYYKLITGNTQKFTFSEKITDKVQISKFFNSYEKLYHLLKIQPQNFLVQLSSFLAITLALFGNQNIYRGIYYHLDLSVIIHNAFSSDIDKDYQYFEQIFKQNSFNTKILSKFLPKLKLNFTQQLLNSVAAEVCESSPQKKKKKSKQKNRKYPDYHTQKQQYRGTIQDILLLPTSPLKFQLLLDQLLKSTKIAKRNILRQKILIKNMLRILQVYELYQYAMILASVCPDFNSIQINIQLYIKSRTNKPQKQTTHTTLEQTIKFCLRNYRRYIVHDAIAFVQQQHKYDKKQIQAMNKEYDEQQKLGKAEVVKSAFMSMEKLGKIVGCREQIVTRMIEEQYINWGRIQMQLCLEQIMHGEAVRNN